MTGNVAWKLVRKDAWAKSTSARAVTQAGSQQLDWASRHQTQKATWKPLLKGKEAGVGTWKYEHCLPFY